MAKIKQLEKQIAELIAAGEVVERPASVIKELVENSIDAGATAVTVEIKNGGNSFIRVTDNGCGIAAEDIPTAFLRHATSKISEKCDLDSILTLGFRGEALASVCAVSKVELLTRTEDSDFGYRYAISGGVPQPLEQAGCALGSTIIVRDLFYNTPARLKFLKKETTESNVVTAVIEHLALSHPEISFRLIRDGKPSLNTPGDGKLHSAIFSVYKKEFADSLLPIDYEMNGVRVTGYACRPTGSRKNRAMQFFFINGRYIRTKTGVAALEQAYKNSIAVGTFPSCVLNLKLSAAEVDVNVHPAKVEVRFSDEQKIFSAVYYAIKSMLAADTSHIEIKPRQKISEPAMPQFEQLPIEQKQVQSVQLNEPPVRYAVSPTPSVSIEYEPPKQTDNYAESPFTLNQPKHPEQLQQELQPQQAQQPQPPQPYQSSQSQPSQSTQQPQHEAIRFKYVGQAFSTYIIVQGEDERLYIIDKHAAHERILFEQIRKNVDNKPQLLLSPLTIRLSANEYDALVSNIERINDAGFELEDFGSGSILVRAVPMVLESEDVSAMIAEIAGKLIGKSRDFSPEFLDWLYHSVACRAAIKAGNRSTQPELESLAEKALNDPEIRYCPHGRPVCIELSRSELERRFLRS